MHWKTSGQCLEVRRYQLRFGFIYFSVGNMVILNTEELTSCQHNICLPVPDVNAIFFGFLWDFVVSFVEEWGCLVPLSSTFPSRWLFTYMGSERMTREHGEREKVKKNENEERKAIDAREKHSRYCVIGIFFYASVLFRKIIRSQM